MSNKSLVESILEEKENNVEEEKIAVSYRIDKSVAEKINEIVANNKHKNKKLKKGEFVSELLKKALNS